MYDRLANEEFARKGAWPSIDGAVEELYEKIDDMGRICLKVTAPVRAASDILRLLYKEDVMPASVMPNYNSVQETIRFFRELFD